MVYEKLKRINTRPASGAEGALSQCTMNKLMSAASSSMEGRNVSDLTFELNTFSVSGSLLSARIQQ